MSIAVPRRARLVLRLVAGMAALGLLLAACGDDSGGDDAATDTAASGEDDGGTEATTSSDCPSEVCMLGIDFTEDTITVSVGDTVTWTNLDSAVHTVTSGTPENPQPEVFDSGELVEGGRFTLTAEAPGEDPYFCTIHPQMQATVVVE